MSWKVDYEPHVKTEIQTQLDGGILSKDDLKALMKWVDEIESHGLEHVQTDYWNDHPLEAEWTGLRSTSFSRVTATHDYRK